VRGIFRQHASILTGVDKPDTIFFSKHKRQSKPGIFGAQLAGDATESTPRRSDEIIFF
jgi:hypothetical protein